MSMQTDLKQSPSVQDAQAFGDDLLIGATEIARELNWKKEDGRWDTRRIYHVAEQGTLPIHRVRGLGICARRSALRAFFERLDEPFLK
jgi:hypothetical protein